MKPLDYKPSIGCRAVFNRNPLLAKELEYRYNMAASFSTRSCKLIVSDHLKKYLNADSTNFAGFNAHNRKHQFYLYYLVYSCTPEYKVNQGFWKTLMDPRNFSSKEEQDRYIQKNLIITNPELQKKAYNLWL